MINTQVEEIRRGKRVNIATLVEDVFTRATYDNYKKGKHDIKLSNFLKIVEKLHLSTDEISILISDDTSKLFKEYLSQIRTHTVNNDVKSLINLRKTVANETYYFSSHLSKLIDFRVSRLSCTKISDKCRSEFFDYLIRTELWTRYEIILFTNSMFIASSELIDILLDRVFKNITYSEHIRDYGDEKFRILLDAFILFFERKEYSYLSKWKKHLIEYELSSTLFFEKTLQRLFSLFIKYITIDNNDRIIEECYEISRSLCTINCKEYSDIVFNMTKFIETNY